MRRLTLLVPLATLVLYAGCSDQPTGVSDPTSAAPVFAGGGSVNVNLDQWSNGTPTNPASWQNGNLNGNNSQYAEGKAVPFRLAVEGLTPGTHTITINHDWTAGGVKAYDFLASVDATEAVGTPAILCSTGGGGVSSLCAGGLGAYDAEPFPADPFADAGGTVDGAIADRGFSAAQRELRIYGGTITGISAPPTHDGTVNGNSTAGMLVTFQSTGSAVLLVWSGHLARSGYWNPGGGGADGAGQISGAPWHMRTLNLDDGGAANQDRSIQPSALVDPGLMVVKSADADPVAAGSPIGFTVTVSNTGTTDTNGVTLSDPLPGGTGIDWAIDGGTAAASCSIGGSPPNETLTCNFGNLAAGVVRTVHVSSATAFASCGLLNNTATASATNHADVQDSDDITVQCPDLDVVKTPDAQTVSAGSPISFTVVVTNSGTGVATGVTLNDPLPGGTGVDWAIGAQPAGDPCSITGSPTSETLTCSFGSMAPGDVRTVTVTSATAFASCKAYPNTATASATNHPNEQDAGSITVQCPDLSIVKTPDAQSVGAGSPISFSMVVTNAGPGTATGVALNDPLPGGPGISWSITAQPAGDPCSISGSAPNQTLACSFGDMAAGQVRTVTVGSATTTASCQVYNNTATATATNHPSRQDTGSLEVVCSNSCTLTIGFWKTHAGQYSWARGNQGDAITALLPRWLGTVGGVKSIQVTTAARAVQILSFNTSSISAGSNGITKLYAQMLAAKLNVANGANGSTIAAAIAAADAFLATNNEADWAGLTKNQKNQVLAWMSTFDTFNNSAHCT